MILALRVRPMGYGMVEVGVRVDPPLARRAYEQLMRDRHLYDYEPERWCYTMADGDEVSVGVIVDAALINVQVAATHDDPHDALDGTAEYLTQLSLDDRLRVVAAVRSLLSLSEKSEV